MSIWFSFLIASLALAYITKVMMLEEQTDHEGPWPSKTASVYFPETEHLQRVAFFDHIRRLFGVYRIESSLWTVYMPRAEVWMCPVCLSLWLSLPVSALLLLSEPFWASPFLVLLPFALAATARTIIKIGFS